MAAQKIPPRLADRLSSQGCNQPSSDKLPALKNQLQMAIEIFRQAMEKNMAEERRRLRRSMWIFVIALTTTTMTLLAGAGWLVYRMQLRMENIVIELARSQAANPPALNPTSATPPAALPTETESTHPAHAGEDLRFLQELRNDLLAVEERSRALDDLLAFQQTRLQSLMLEILDLQTDANENAPVDWKLD
ncbi:MAG: hypothetical protein ABR497_10210 [Kiritimatiellia bacterium]|nr:hypothetical protein [Lentisphaerota bacterium]